MALIERLMGIDDHDKLPVHQFTGGLAEYVRGHATAQQVIDLFALDADDQTEAQTLLDRVNNGTLTREEVEDVLLLAEQRRGYDTPATVRNRLGI